MKVIDRKDAINHRIYNNQSFVETAIYRVSSLNRTVFNTFRLRGKGFEFPFPHCPLTFPHTKREIIEFNRKVLEPYWHH